MKVVDLWSIIESLRCDEKRDAEIFSKEFVGMAVQKSKKTPSKRNMRRSHDSLRDVALTVEASSGEAHRRHHISPSGFYRVKRFIEIKDKSED